MKQPADRSPRSGRARPTPETANRPGWAKRLGRLYDDVLAEPLPESLKNLLQRLDRPGDD